MQVGMHDSSLNISTKVNHSIHNERPGDKKDLFTVEFSQGTSTITLYFIDMQRAFYVFDEVVNGLMEVEKEVAQKESK